MKAVLQFLFILVSVGGTLAQTQIVVPGGLAEVEGNSSVSEPFNSTSFRFQQVFDASQFAGIGNEIARIDMIYFRIDGASTEDVVLFFGGSSVQLSTTQRAPDGLSPVFAENRGIDALTVWNGAFSTGGVPGPNGPPYSFHGTFQLSTPFFYKPSQGNLLLDVIAGSGQAFLPGALDAHSSTGDSISSVYANTAGASFGTAQTVGLVTKFDITVIPEPTSLLLLLMGLVAVVSKRK